MLRYIQPRKLPHLRFVHLKLIKNPIVQLPSNLKLQTTQGIIHLLQRITDTMSKIISGVHAPSLPKNSTFPVRGCALSFTLSSAKLPVAHRVSQSGVWVGVVDFQTYTTFAFLGPPFFHVLPS